MWRGDKNCRYILMIPVKNSACKGLTHWAEWSIYASVNYHHWFRKWLSPSRRQGIIWTNAGILLIWSIGTEFSEILIEMNIFSFTIMHLNKSSAKCLPFCSGINVVCHPITSKATLRDKGKRITRINAELGYNENKWNKLATYFVGYVV